MDWKQIGGRIRHQREYLGYTREQLAELIEVTPKFCADIELGVKGMSVPTLCRLAQVLHLSTDYILRGVGRPGMNGDNPLQRMMDSMSPQDYGYAEQLLKTFVLALDAKRSEEGA